MPAVARLLDYHSCPKVDSVPHMGGPIIEVANADFLIDGRPVACVDDQAICLGPKDIIASGSAAVSIGGKPVARVNDNTVHGGLILTGSPTVEIGGPSIQVHLIGCNPSYQSCIAPGTGFHAFKRDANGNIIATPVGVDENGNIVPVDIKPLRFDANGNLIATEGYYYITGHIGAPNTDFIFHNYTLELENGDKIIASKSFGVLDGSQVTPDGRMDTDCHGVTFADGQYWINDTEVDKILSGSGYAPTNSPQPGDVGVYRDLNGNPVHSVTVTGVHSNGEVAAVSGLGGLETTVHTDLPEDGWGNPDHSIDYYTLDGD